MQFIWMWSLFRCVMVKKDLADRWCPWWTSQSPFSLQSTCDHELSVMTERTKRLEIGWGTLPTRTSVWSHCSTSREVSWGGSGIWSDASPGRCFRRVPPARDPRKTLGFLGSVDLETPLNPVGEGRSLGIPATFWGTLLPSTQFLFLHWPHCRNRMKSKLTGLQSLSCKGPERPGFDHETPSVPLLQSYGACKQSYWVECVNFRINKGRLLSSNTSKKTF